MAFPLTEEQRKIVDDRGGELLVSAAAGSGKTRVLVERLLDRVTKEGLDIDRFLVITYTKAAAAELRSRVAQELSARLAERPNDRHLRRQSTLVYQAQISTIHSFCSALLRESGHLLDLDPDFRLCDEGEAQVLMARVLEEVLDKVYAAGYPDTMIIQDFIPGDDSYMRVLTNYSDRNGRVTMMCLGHVLLEEHSPHGIGNHAVIITEEDQALELKIKDLLESLHYTGFSNFDIKYDSRDGKYKAFEINCRQGRSNYYVTGAGHNIARLLVEDRIEGKDKELEITRNRSLWRMVPRKVAFKFTPKKYHQEMKALIRAGADSHSLVYEKDASLKRRLRVMKNHLGNMKRFDQYNKVPED